MVKLSDAHAVVTGGSRGIGAAIARRLDDLGLNLTLLGRNLAPLQAQCDALRSARAVTVDVTDSNSVAAAITEARRQFGPVHVLVNNAGAAASAPLEKTGDDLWEQMIAVNLTGSFNCARAVLADMRAAKWGRIINIASTAGLVGYAYVSAYCAAKHGLVGFTRALALETAKTGVTVNALCPGYTRTDLLDAALHNIVAKTGLDREGAERQLQAANPQGRFVEPEEVAAAVAWLCQPGSDAITGQAIAIAGGEVM